MERGGNSTNATVTITASNRDSSLGPQQAAAAAGNAAGAGSSVSTQGEGEAGHAMPSMPQVAVPSGDKTEAPQTASAARSALPDGEQGYASKGKQDTGNCFWKQLDAPGSPCADRGPSLPFGSGPQAQAARAAEAATAPAPAQREKDTVACTAASGASPSPEASASSQSIAAVEEQAAAAGAALASAGVTGLSPMQTPASDLVTRIFGGQLASLIRCCECGYTSVRSNSHSVPS